MVRLSIANCVGRAIRQFQGPYRSLVSGVPASTSTFDGPPVPPLIITPPSQVDQMPQHISTMLRGLEQEAANAEFEVLVPRGRRPDESSFHPEYTIEFRASQVAGAGTGWYAKVDIPSGVCLRRVSIEDGSLLRIGSEEELRATGWNIDEAVNYGIGHRLDPSAIYFLQPGTAINHADPCREASIEYKHVNGALELWTTKDVKAGEEMLCDYAEDYGVCAWYDELRNRRRNTPLSRIPRAVRMANASWANFYLPAH